MRCVVVLAFLISCTAAAQSGVQPVGSWQEYLPYGSAIDVTASPTRIYCATPYSLFSVDSKTKEIERMSRVSGLSETGVSAIQYDAASNKLFIAYTNSNIDVLDKTALHNIPGLKQKDIAGDKTVYAIYADNNLCYLSTGLGIIVLDAQKYEIKDSWFIGNGGQYVKTFRVAKDQNFFYAATTEGLKKAAINNINLADFRAWQNVSGSNGLQGTACQGVVTVQNQVIALQNDSLFVQHGTGWDLFFANGWPVVSINAAENTVVVCQRTASGDSKVVLLNSNGSILNTLQRPAVVSFPQKAITHNGEYWIADLYGGLSHWYASTLDQYKPASPEDIATGEMTVYHNKLYAAAGSVNEAWNYQYNSSGIYQYADNEWTNFNRFHFSPLDSLLDFITVAVDPRDESVWGGSYGGGLVHILQNNGFKIYKQASPIGPAIGDPGSYRVSGLAFDRDNNLWVSNYGAAQYLHVLKSDGTWKSFTSPFSFSENAVAQMVVDDENQKWIVAPKSNGLICFNHGASIDNTNDDRWKWYKSGKGSGGLPSNNVLCVAKDKSGFVWVGTDNGIAIIQCPKEIFNSGCEALLPVVKDGSFANYLFNGEEVRSIAVDGADRKWIATPAGVWLISSEGDKVLSHFTEENSPLLSNDVKRVAINGTTGEVFLGTAKGICSFRGDATEVAEEKHGLLVFPNPVPPGYSGTIAIKGVKEGSYVKITELNGRLVYQTKALGGQAVWNGRDYNNHTISSGIYLVLVIDETRQEKSVGKIVFIAK